MTTDMDPADYVKLVETQFSFLCTPKEGEEHPLMWGFFKEAIFPKAAWGASCGYWNGWFVLKFELDLREGIHQVSLGKRRLGSLTLGPALPQYDLRALIGDVGGLIIPESRASFAALVLAQLDAYAEAMQKSGDVLLMPDHGPSPGEWDYQRFERYRYG